MAGIAPSDWAVDPSTAGAREVAPGLWRLRLPLAWPGNDHANAWAIDGVGGGIVLVDCGAAGDPGYGAALDVALAAAGRRIEEVELLVGTHAHSDHIGLAAHVIDRSGCPFWAHPATAALYDGFHDPDGIARKRTAFAQTEGVPSALLPGCGDTGEETDAVLRPVEPDVALRAGMTVPTALGTWEVLETPGHSPSQLALVQAERRTIVVADLVCAAFAPWFDIGYSPDPYGEWQASLARIRALDDDEPFVTALAGHGRPMADLRTSLREHADGLAARLEAVHAAVVAEPGGAWDVTRRGLRASPDPAASILAFDEGLGYLRHLHVTGRVVREVVDSRATHRPA